MLLKPVTRTNQDAQNEVKLVDLKSEIEVETKIEIEVEIETKEESINEVKQEKKMEEAGAQDRDRGEGGCNHGG